MIELDELRTVAEACTMCRLAQTRTQVVFGVGRSDSELMFVGEAPGRNEDIEGVPFVGRAGQLLDQLLGEVGIPRETVYIANVIKCRPPNNRDPQPDEIDACKGYLRQQIRLIRPRVVVTLGNFATKLLLNTTTGMLGIVFILQVDYFSATVQRALPFLILPFFLWLAFRFELILSTAGVLCVSLVAIYFTVQNQGPFVLSEPYHSVLLIQIFVSVLSISTLVLSATVRERTVIQKKLQEFNENLEAKVLERTKALNDEILTRKEAEIKLQNTNMELSKRNTELDNFVYSVSHDLRAPIASVLGLINLARKDKDMAMKDTYLEMINKSALQQDHFIKEILDQSRNSRLDIKREEVLFEPIIVETFNQLRFATPTGKAVEKIITVHQNKPFYCDRWRLKVILNNIISNSIRYRNGRDPLIKVNVDVTEKGAKVSIEDNGKGIASEHLKNVCRMFYRATDDGAGSGLGLYIVKEAIDKLNGSIKIDSVEGQGTTVELLIPEVV